MELSSALARARQGDEEAFRELYRAVHPGLLRYLRVLVNHDYAEAEDIASETWLQVVRDLGRFTGDLEGFRAWCATIGRHRALDHLRSRRRRPASPVAPEDLLNLPADADTASAALAGIATDWALDLISTLSPDQAEAVLLRVVVGLDAKRAAEVLGKRPGAVRTAAHRGLARLRSRLEPGESGAATAATAVTAVAVATAPPRGGRRRAGTFATPGRDIVASSGAEGK